MTILHESELRQDTISNKSYYLDSLIQQEKLKIKSFLDIILNKGPGKVEPKMVEYAKNTAKPFGKTTIYTLILSSQEKDLSYMRKIVSSVFSEMNNYAQKQVSELDLEEMTKNDSKVIFFINAPSRTDSTLEQTAIRISYKLCEKNLQRLKIVFLKPKDDKVEVPKIEVYKKPVASAIVTFKSRTVYDNYNRSSVENYLQEEEEERLFDIIKK